MMLNARELSPDQKLAVESLLGRPVSEEEIVSVRAFEPPDVSEECRQEIAEGLRRLFAEMDANLQPLSGEEAEDAVNEAMRSTRPGYRPRQ